MADCGLNDEPIQHGSILAVVVEPIDQVLALRGFICRGAPHHSLVEVRDPQAVVLVVEDEKQLIQGLGHVIDAARIRRRKNLAIEPCAVEVFELGSYISLGDRPGTAISVHAHRSEVDDVDVQAALHYGAKQIVGRGDVVIDGVALLERRLHRIGRRALLGEVHHRVRLNLPQESEKPVVIERNVDPQELYRAPSNRLPRA
jgi:hypothetical protein